MKRPVKSKAKDEAARDLFAELNEGMEALAEAARKANPPNSCSGVVTPPEPNPCTQGPEDLARALRRLSAHQRSQWKTGNEGRAKPNAQAALLINLVKRYPDTVQRFATI
jgi:putative transcriptional regulator